MSEQVIKCEKIELTDEQRRGLTIHKEPLCDLCGKPLDPLDGETGVHYSCAAEEQWWPDRQSEAKGE